MASIRVASGAAFMKFAEFTDNHIFLVSALRVVRATLPIRRPSGSLWKDMCCDTAQPDQTHDSGGNGLSHSPPSRALLCQC